MPYPTITIEALVRMNPCNSGLYEARRALVKHGDRPINAQQAVDAGINLDRLLWVARTISHHDADVRRRLKLWMADCAARVLHLFERARPTDARPREAIVAARAFARGEIGEAARDAAIDAVRLTVFDDTFLRPNLMFRCADYASTASWEAVCGFIGMGVARMAAEAVGLAALEGADSTFVIDGAAAAAAEEKEWQRRRLALWLTDEPSDLPL